GQRVAPAGDPERALRVDVEQLRLEFVEEFGDAPKAGPGQADIRVQRERQGGDPQLALAGGSDEVRIARRHDGHLVALGAQQRDDAADHGRHPVDLGEVRVGDESYTHEEHDAAARSSFGDAGVTDV